MTTRSHELLIDPVTGLLTVKWTGLVKAASTALGDDTEPFQLDVYEGGKLQIHGTRSGTLPVHMFTSLESSPVHWRDQTEITLNTDVLIADSNLNGFRWVKFELGEGVTPTAITADLEILLLLNRKF